MHYLSRYYSSRRLFSLLAAIVALSIAPVFGNLQIARAVSNVVVRYDALHNVIYLGDDYKAGDPAQAPYVGYPSNPSAPKSAITIPEVSVVLAAQGHANLLVQQGDAWTLKADMVISPTARLDATSATLKELRLDSTPGSRVPALTRLVARGGYLNIDGIRVLSWDGTAPDTKYADGRSYVLAENGGRIDILNAEVAYLGWRAGESSGLAWLKRGASAVADGSPTDDMNIIRTGSTGSILRSNIHDNYFGLYAFEAYGLVVQHSAVHHNVVYGLAPHDYSTGFDVAFNKMYDNGKHGIIFSRGCTLNRIHDNQVYNNAEHGIMLERGSNINQITNNIVYNNSDGVAIFQSEKNVIQHNMLHDNERGIRINATFEQGDLFDGWSNANLVLNNTIRDNTQYGVYLYDRADTNTIEGNTISGNAVSGVAIKTGGNTIAGNIIRVNTTGIMIVGGEPITLGGMQSSYAPGSKNVIKGNTIEDNNATGIQLNGAVATMIGADGVTPHRADANVIRTNGSYGISLDERAAQNTIAGNIIQGNQADGVLVKGAASARKVSQNSITANGHLGINRQDGGSRTIAAPIITSAADAPTVTGTAANAAGGTVEVYRDNDGEGAVYKGSTTVGADGTWSFTLPANDNAHQGSITALLIDKYGNTSPFGGNAANGSQATYTVGAGNNGETTVFVSGPGANVTLPDIQRALKVISPTTDLLVLENPADKVWMSNVSLFIDRGVTLTLTTDTVSWLKLRSQETDIQLPSATQQTAYNYKSFTTLRTYNGVIRIDGVKITSWDPTQNAYDTNIENGRSYILAKYNARMDIKNADLSYLGSADGESYGVAWRDINSSDQPDVLLTRVTGDVENSNFSNNYYGIYTFQARDMIFRNNTFHNNIGYGFDPHDFSHHFTIENNESFENGNHGFIISRGCNNFVFRNNKSYNNHYTVGSEDRNAHGFMIDPGSPNSRFPQVPSHDNLLENNQSYGNDGYGLRIVGSISNTVQMNTFTNNLQGITLEQGSTDNIIATNVISGSGQYGIYLFGGSDRTTITGNTIAKSGKHGIYIKTGNNSITKNAVTDNGTIIDNTPLGSGIATLQESATAAALHDLTRPGQPPGPVDMAMLPLSAAQSSNVTGNAISQNTVARNANDGIELKNATHTLIEANTLADNGSDGLYVAVGASANMARKNIMTANAGYGIRANGADVLGNTWTENSLYQNRTGGIVNTSNANNGIEPPQLHRNGNQITGITLPGTIVELFSDDNGQGRYVEARITAGSDGSFSATQAWKGAMVNATVTDQSGNTSGFSFNMGFGPNSMRVYLPFIGRSTGK